MIADMIGVVVLTLGCLVGLACFFHLGEVEKRVKAPDLTSAPPRVSHLRRRPSKFAGSSEQEALKRMRDDMRERLARKSG